MLHWVAWAAVEPGPAPASILSVTSPQGGGRHLSAGRASCVAGRAGGVLPKHKHDARWSNAHSPAAAHRPRRGGGAGRPGSHPVASDLIAKGTKTALLGRLRRPPGAWIGLSTMPRGIPEARLRRTRAPWPRTCAEGAPASTPNPARGRLGGLSRARRRLDGLSTMPADAPGHDTPAPSPSGTAAAAPPDLPRRPQHAAPVPPASSSAHIHDDPVLTIPAAGNVGCNKPKAHCTDPPSCQQAGSCDDTADRIAVIPALACTGAGRCRRNPSHHMLRRLLLAGCRGQAPA
jgi:hypothetical protein